MTSTNPFTCRRLLTLPMVALVAMQALAAGPDDAINATPSLARPTSSEKRPDDQGFLQRWMILEPISSNGLTDSAVRQAVAKEYFPGQLSTVPHDGDKVATEQGELTWHAVDTKEYNVNLFHFARALDKPTSNVLLWSVTTVNCPNEMKDVRLAIGSNAASVWWVNGQEVISIFGDRQTVIDDGVSRRITLKKGPNVVRCAVINGGGAMDFCARFLDADDKPLKNVTVTLGSLAK